MPQELTVPDKFDCWCMNEAAWYMPLPERLKESIMTALNCLRLNITTWFLLNHNVNDCSEPGTFRYLPSKWSPFVIRCWKHVLQYAVSINFIFNFCDFMNYFGFSILCLDTKFTNFVEQSGSWEAGVFSAGQPFYYFFFKRVSSSIQYLGTTNFSSLTPELKGYF